MRNSPFASQLPYKEESCFFFLDAVRCTTVSPDEMAMSGYLMYSGVYRVQHPGLWGMQGDGDPGILSRPSNVFKG